MRVVLELTEPQLRRLLYICNLWEASDMDTHTDLGVHERLVQKVNVACGNQLVLRGSK